MISKEQLQNRLLKEVYSDSILNNSHRGDIVEIMLLEALGSDWELVGLGWHPWDIETSVGGKRIRLQVKQCAALQLWGPTKKMQLSFPWSKKAPDYFERDNPGVEIENEGYLCDFFVIGLHLEDDPNKADQLNCDQWSFLVIPVEELHDLGCPQSMVLSKALNRWTPVKLSEVKGFILR